MPPPDESAPNEDRRTRILDAALRLLAGGGIASVSIRAVAREADVALGLVNYYFTDKTGLVASALRRIEEQDLALLELEAGSPQERLRRALHLVAKPEYLTTEYLSLRLQLWSLAQVHQEYEKINTRAQQRYRSRLAGLIDDAHPDLDDAECRRRAEDIDVVQNGIWLTALLGLDRASVDRAVERCERIAADG